MSSRPLRSCRSSNEQLGDPMDWEEEEDDYFRRKRTTTSGDSNVGRKDNRKLPASPLKKSQRSNKKVKNYCEASSDDDYAKQNFMFESSDEEMEQSKNSSKSSRRQKSKKNNNQAPDDSDSGDNNRGDEIEYRIQHILGKKSMPQSQWREMNEHYTTIEVTKGSVWQQPDEEYFDDSPEPLEKFLIKWMHASYLHVSWETEKDLMDMVGPTAKQHIKKFRLREFEGRELFEDLSKGEFVPPSYYQIERILDVDDPEVDMYQVDWETALLPEAGDKKNAAAFAPVESAPIAAIGDSETVQAAPLQEETAEEDVEEEIVVRRSGRRAAKRSVSLEDDDEPANAPPVTTKMFGKTGRSKKQKLCQYLHGNNCWVTVKWEGLPYSDVSFECINDLIIRGVEFESPLRAFYRREQRCLSEPPMQKKGARKLILDQTIIGSNSTPPPFPGGTLRDYQWEGVRWMLFNLVQGRNCILADEMGLGKTIQSSTLLHMVKKHQASSGPFLVVAPLSTIVNWQREISTWTSLDSILYYGSQEDRDLIRSYEFKYLNAGTSKSNKTNNSNGYKIEVVITTPETCVAFDDKNGAKRELSKIPWDIVIVDEAHKLKNYDSKLSSTLREDYSFKNCVLLTGTPLQNNTDELWTLLNFVAAEDFDDRDTFIDQFGELKSSAQLESLHKRIKPYLLRREKENVEKGVPPKEEIIIEVELTVPQKQYYRAIYEQKTGFLYKSGTKDGPSLSNLAMELRKCCNHPFLIKGAANEISKHFGNDSPHDVLVKSSGKMTLLDKLLPKLQKDGHRVLIFSQFRMMLDLIEDYLHSMGYLYERVDGSVVGKKRQAAIDRYSQNDNLFVMLLSTKAGGVGINLTAADTVIIYDSDWNPQNDIQAQARAHRIGQTRAVTVYRLLTKKTYEMVMFRAASIKLGLDYAVMHNLGSTVDVHQQSTRSGSRRRGKNHAGLEGISNEKAEHVSSLSKKELETLLKHGAYDMFIEEKEGIAETESSKFVEESIEQILERSSVIIHKGEDESNDDVDEEAGETDQVPSSTTTSKKSKGSNFAKASFVSASETSGENNEVAIDDPDFWSKVIGLAVEEEDNAIGTKRKCRQLVENYKEPTDSIRSIYGSMQNAYASDSDESVASEGKRKRRKKDEVVPAEFTSENILSVVNAIIALGFTNWNQIKKVSKLRWTLEDIQKAAKLGVMYILLASSVTFGEESASKKEITIATENNDAVKCEGVTDYAFMYQAVRKYKLTKLLLHGFLKHGNQGVSTGLVEEETMVTSVLHALLDTFSEETSVIPVEKYKEAFDKAFLPTYFDGSLDMKLDEIKAFVDTLNSLPEIQSLKANENDGEKQQKRVMNFKSKLAQVEDLFEAQLYCMLSNIANPNKEMEISEERDKSFEVHDSTANIAETGDTAADAKQEDTLGQGDVPATPIVYPKPNTFLPAKLDGLLQDSFTDKDKDKTPSWWSRSYDSALLHTVFENGWPEGKRRLAGVMGTLIQLPPADDSNVSMADLITPKFIMQRFKSLVRSMRYSEEDVAAAAKAVASAKASAKTQLKKNVVQILKLVQKNGYPRSCYDSVVASLKSKIEHSEEQINRIGYLYSWQALARECNMEGNETEVQEVVHAALDFFNNEADGYTGETITSGLLEDIPVKLIKPAFEKSDIIHHIRLTLAMHSEQDIKSFIVENCKGTGPNIPGFKRDMTMPVWWTLDHDISLLKLCLVHGYGAWKPITLDPIVSTTPEDFVMPSKVNGVEWVIQLTTRNAEKRVLALLRGMPQVKSLSLPAPTSPQKKGQNILQVAPLPSVNKSIFWFQQQKSSTKAAGDNSPGLVLNRTASESSTVSTSGNPAPAEAVAVLDATEEKRKDGDKEQLVVDLIEKVLPAPSASATMVDNAKHINAIATEATPEERQTGEDYVNNINAVRGDSPVNVIIIEDEDLPAGKPNEVANLSPMLEKPTIPIDLEKAPKSPLTPTKDITKKSSTVSAEGSCKNTVQTPQVQASNAAPAIEKKGKKTEKGAPKTAAPVPASKSILSFFKKV